jgi:hypothetical protein
MNRRDQPGQFPDRQGVIPDIGRHDIDNQGHVIASGAILKRHPQYPFRYLQTTNCKERHNEDAIIVEHGATALNDPGLNL